MVAGAGSAHDRRMLVNREQETPRMRTFASITRRASITPGRIACAVALTVAVGWLAAPAPASATTMNHIWNYMRFPASSEENEDLRGCTVRTIVTGPGTYRWRIFSAHWAHTDQPLQKTRVLRLRRARYSWSDCWLPDGRAWSRHSQLRNVSHGGNAYLHGQNIKGSFGHGSYHMGSTLDRVR
jgi:hypothetical protein